MFKIKWRKDIAFRDSKKVSKITGVTIICGYNCINSCWCQFGSKCKYRGRFGFHNFHVSLSNWTFRHFGFRLRFPVSFQKSHVDLSGTLICPYKAPRVYTCWECEYGQKYRECTNQERHEIIQAGKYHEIEEPFGTRRCKLFKLGDWVKGYDPKTGEWIWR